MVEVAVGAAVAVQVQLQGEHVAAAAAWLTAHYGLAARHLHLLPLGTPPPHCSKEQEAPLVYGPTTLHHVAQPADAFKIYVAREQGDH